MAGSPCSFSTCPFLQIKVEEAKTSKSGFKQLVAGKEYTIGETLFAVDGLLVTSKEGWGCVACNDTRCMGWCDPYRYYFVELRSALLAVPKIAAETDTNPNVLRLAIKYVALKRFASQNSKLQDHLTNVFDLVNLRDSATEKKEDAAVAEKLYLNFPDSHKSLLTKEQLATLIGIFKTNTHEVGHMQGLGLFPVASLVSHSCFPNAVYETVGTKIFFTAISQIPAGTPITVSYINPHQPRADRREQLKNLFHFDCKCKRCHIDSRDHSRAFYCQACASKGLSPDEIGIVAPKGDGSNIADWICLKCGEGVQETLWKEMLAFEAELKETEVGMIKFNDLVNLRKIHPTHYLLCRALEYRVDLLAKIRPASCEKFILTLLAASESIYPPIHPQKAVYYDLLGQVRKMTGDLKGCKEALQEAVNIREKSCPRGSPVLLLAKQKNTNPEKVEISLWFPTMSM
eukprot:TRINITY_DN4885_c0_g1_i1.p1 TRINITY_DN4885_c0_g1~~TRINITY_DN4885_c0_g1_i1.p1  ORF type:complete len:483 (+),score=97.88 TRINITY_DN4885_c0_g1_i1:77-1450(+)